MTAGRSHADPDSACRRNRRLRGPAEGAGLKTHRRPAGARDSLLTVAEVLAELQVARSTFDTWRSLGCAPECIKLPNGQIRVRRGALEAWLAERTEVVDVS